MIHLHRSSRADGLVGALAATVSVPLEDPFAPEVIAVPTRGVERWISQQLSSVLGAGSGRTDGVCANVAWPSPRRVIEEAVAAASDVDPETDPWRPERALWPLLEVVEADLDSFGPFARHLELPDRRLPAVRHLTQLFEKYGVQRPELILAWADGADPDDWQARLWRALRKHLDVPSPAERLLAACARLREEPSLAELPERLAVFGLTRLPPSRLAVLDALAEHRDVHLHLLHPSPALWRRVAGSGPVVDRRRVRDVTARLPQHHLLASWAQDARELQIVLAATEPNDHEHLTADPPATLLGRLQAELQADRAPTAPMPLTAEDESLTVYACHGRARQVEVLRDALLHRLRRDPSLELRDVIVLCPDIEAFAPLIRATFGAVVEDEEDGESTPDHGLPRLRIRLADRALRQTNPVLGVVARVLELATSRATASDLLDLADREPVRRRFGLDDDALARVESWAADAGVRWGLDAPGRTAFGLGTLDHGTWARGWQRVLLGAAMTEDGGRLVGGVLPLDDVPAGDIDLAGRVAELLDRTTHVLSACRDRRRPADWADLVADAADFLCATSTADAWQRVELDGVLSDLRRDAKDATTEISVAELRDLLGDRLAGRPTRANFRSGALTFCTMHPMRAVPHRIVCLLGLDDDVFPRGAPRDGDDRTLAEPHIGDHDGRLEDRQLLLDAVMSATDAVLVTYSGRDERTNAERPPAVPIGELLEAVARSTGHEAVETVLQHHPLQPFDPRAFSGSKPWGFDRYALAGAAALVGAREAAPEFLAERLPPVHDPTLDLDDLVRFTASPVKAFLRRRLGIAASDWADDPLDDLTLELDALDRYAIGQRLLDARLAGVEHRASILAEIARGTLPPGYIAQGPVVEVAEDVEALLAVAAPLIGGVRAADSRDVRVVLGDSRRLGGTVTGIVADELVRSVSYARLSPKHRLAAWVRLLTLTVARPEERWRSVTVGRGGQGSDALVSSVGPLNANEALRRLEELVDLFDRGQREPLPMSCKASAAYAAAPQDPIEAARGMWTSRFNWDNEDREPEHALVWGEGAPLERLLEASPLEDEDGDGWTAEPSRFGRLARRQWDGLLEHEQLEER